MRTHYLSLALLSAVLVGCGPEEPEPAADMEMETEAPATELPDEIVAERGGFIPEGIEYDPGSDRLLTGSLPEGTIFHLQADGSLTPVIEDPDLVSSVGIEVDEDRNRLLVANSDFRAFQGESQGQAMLGAYDLESGERLAMVNLAALLTDAPGDATFFANDVAVDDEGAAYVTDTFNNVLFRVGPMYEPSVLHRFEPMEGLSLNGIVFHPSGYLLVAGGSTLHKVPIDDPASVSQVELPETIEGMDGLVWTPDMRLAIVSNSQSRVVALDSTDDWATAEMAGEWALETQGTTAAVAEGDLYVVHPHFADQEPPTVTRIDLQ